MLKKLRLSTFTAALSMGGFIGWLLTVMFICERSLHYYRDDTLFFSVNTTFLTAELITIAALAVILLLLDFEGLLSDKLFRWLPGMLLAESGVALSLATVGTMTVFSAVAGVAAAFGMLAALTHLLRVKVGQRLITIGVALAVGGAIRLLAGVALTAGGQAALMLVSAAAGIIACLTVHSIGFSSQNSPLISLAEAEPGKILSKIPTAYIALFILCAAFFFAQNYVSSYSSGKLPDGYTGFDYAAYAGFIIASLVIAVLCRPSMLPMIFVCAAGLSAAASLWVGLPYMTAPEAHVFAFISYAALACFRACVFLFVILFSLDRPHPMFYAVFGYGVAVAGELAGTSLSGVDGVALRASTVTMLLLIPIGGIFLSAAMRKYGFSQDKLDQRHQMRALIRQRSTELELFEREQMMVESVVLDGSGIEELSAKMLFSHNTVKVLLRPVFEKLGVDSIAGMREYFDRLNKDKERFLEKVQQAESKLREERRMEKSREVMQTFRARIDKYEAEKKEKERQKLERQTADEAAVVTGELVESPEESTAGAVEEAVETTVADSFGDTVEETAVEDNTEEISEDSADGSADDSVDDPADDSADGSADDSAEDSAEDSADGNDEKTASDGNT